VFRKPEKTRNAAEQKIADDYHVVFKVTAAGLKPFMPAELLKQYTDLQKASDAIRPPADLAEFWTVEEDSARLRQPSYILASGEPSQPQKDKPVEPGFPFQPANLEFRDGRRETFAEGLVDAKNPLFARVAVNRLWQWHFRTPRRECFSTAIPASPGDTRIRSSTYGILASELSGILAATGANRFAWVAPLSTRFKSFMVPAPACPLRQVSLSPPR
jgi:hypothetical protein